ncbi:hypothetical protein evm_003889 [Chilo suppressalis]|nr:hypothetical protein evm_003889 [Chilo suppressalis]
MAHRKGVEAVDRTLRDIRQNDRPMGGITVLFCGDFRQTLPVIPRGTRADEVRACLKSSYLWRDIQSVHLTINMRVRTGDNPDDPLQTSDLYWCAPVAVTEGEQLVQLYGGRTVKLRVQTYPHSTLLQLRDVDEVSDPRQTQVPLQTSDLYWCALVAVTEGEQLVQLYGGRTVKLRVQTYPHSTLLQLRDVDETDISASDIRNRLLKPQLTKEKINESGQPESSFHILEREKADSQLLAKAVASGVRIESDPNIPIVIESDSTELLQTSTRKLKSHEVQKSVTIMSSDSHLKLEEKPEIPETSTADDTDHTNRESLKVIKDTSGTQFHASVRINEDSCPSEASVNIDKKFIETDTSYIFQDIPSGCNGAWSACERARFVVSSLALEVAGGADEPPLLALHLDRAALLLHADDKGTNTTLSIAGVQVDNLQYSNGQYDFAVVASTANERLSPDRWPFLWGMLVERDAFSSRQDEARLLLKIRRDHWTVPSGSFSEITEVEVCVGPLALYVEDAYVSALVEVARAAVPVPAGGAAGETAAILADSRALQVPLRLRLLQLHPLHLTLTLHTAVRMYIALDQSPLQLGAFQLKDVVTSVERLTHALTVHYLSAAILGAGWVVGGLELLGAPGALAARVGGAGGGVRGVAVAAAAAVVRSLAACAGSLARNLDLLAGDEEHARRAAAARRRHPQSLAAGILAGVTNFAINILGAVGGLAHHPLVGVAVGEGSSAAALRRSLVGAVAKPLSATADLVAYAGHGLLTQAGWEALPQFLVVADLETERIVEMIDFRSCSLAPYNGPVIELYVTQRRMSKIAVSRVIDEDDEYQVSFISKQHLLFAYISVF